MSKYGLSPGQAFAEGFASSFASTYQAVGMKKKQQEADLVKFNMERFVRKEDEFKAAEIADAKKVDVAKKFATANGLPDDAWGNLYNDLSMGITPNQVQAKIDGGSYTQISKSTNNVVTTEAELPSVDARTSSQTDALLETNTERQDQPADVKVPGENLFQRMTGGMADLFNKEKRQEKREERILESTLEKLDISQSEYDRILNGYTSVAPEISYVYSAKKDPSKAPKWQSLANVTKDNYVAFAAEARANDDEDQAIAIESVGKSIGSASPDYADFSSMTKTNAAGRLLAAQSANKPLIAQKIETWMETNVDPDSGPKYKDFASMTVSNSRGRLVAARRSGDADAVEEITNYILEKDQAFPDKIDEEWITSQYTKFAIAANRPNASEEDKLAFQNFKELELPAYMEAYKLVNPQDDALTFEQAWTKYYSLKNDPESDPDEITQALNVANGAIIGMSIQENVKQNGGKPVSLVKIGEDGTAEFVTSATPQFTGDGKTTYIDGYGSSVGEGYRLVTKDEDEAREKVVNAISTRRKAYDANFVVATGAVRLYGELADMVLENDAVLFGTSGTAKTASNVLKEIKNGLSIIGSVFDANKNADLPEEITPDMVERRLQQQGILQQGQTLEQAASIDTFTLGDSVEDLAKKKAAFDAKLILMAFRAGGLEGQTGMAMSNKDFERLKDVVNASKDGKTFVTELGKYVQGRIDTLKDDASLLQNDAGRVGFQNRYGYDPYSGNSPVTEWSSLTEEGAEMDPRLQKGFDILSGDYTFDEKKPDVVTVPQGSVDMMKSMVGTDQYELYKKLFINKYNQAAFDALGLETNQ
jgi:hypothetical protein